MLLPFASMLVGIITWNTGLLKLTFKKLAYLIKAEIHDQKTKDQNKSSIRSCLIYIFRFISNGWWWWMISPALGRFGVEHFNWRGWRNYQYPLKFIHYRINSPASRRNLAPCRKFFWQPCLFTTTSCECRRSRSSICACRCWVDLLSLVAGVPGPVEMQWAVL